MSELNLWIAFIGLMLVTLFSRGFFLLVGSRFQLSEVVHEFLRYAPTAALIAIVLPEILFTKNISSNLFELKLYTPQLFGGIVGIIVFSFTKSMLSTIFFGMMIYTAARFLI